VIHVQAVHPRAPPRAAPPRRGPSTLFAGLTERSGVVGDPKAPVTVTEYLDLQCPVCKHAAETTLPVLVRDYVRTGKVKLAARTLHFLGPDSDRAARVAAGAERQGRLWPFLDAFYARQGAENSGYVTDGMLRETARAAGVDLGPALAGADSDFASDRLQRANDDAARIGVQGTPTLTVRHGSGPERVLAANPLDPASVAAALDKELAR
jgi:protein-disulfide isomerase